MSCSRRCDIYPADDGKFYLRLGDFEYAYEKIDCTTYGPFESTAKAEKFLFERFSNPVGIDFTKDVEPAPKKAVDGAQWFGSDVKVFYT